MMKEVDRMGRYKDFWGMMRNWMARDYWTQSVRSEIIIDTLISDFVGKMIAAQLKANADTVRLLAKEFPIKKEIDPEKTKKTKTGETVLSNDKVDYLVAVEKTLYLVELKTTAKSYSPNQLRKMKDVQGQKNEELWKFFFRILSSKIINKNNRESIKYVYTLYNIEKEEGILTCRNFNDYFCHIDESVVDRDCEYLSGKYEEIKLAYIGPKKLRVTLQNENVPLVSLNELVERKGVTWERFKNMLGENDNNWALVASILSHCIEREKPLDLNSFDAEVRKIYELLHGRNKKDFPAVAHCSAYQELFYSAQENGPEDFIEFLSDFECLAYELLGGRVENARFAGKEMEDLPKLVLNDFLTGT